MRRSIITMVMLLVGGVVMSAAVAPVDEERPGSTTRPTTRPMLRIAAELKGAEPGILVEAPKTISASARPEGQFVFRIVNMLDEEVFVEVTEYDAIAVDLDHPKAAETGMRLSLRSRFPNTALLKRLHASRVHEDGKRITCRCGVARVTVQLGVDDLKQWVGGKGTMNIPVRGFYRSNGEAFEGKVKLPVEIVP